jgi:hypothetical protein
VEGAAIRIPFKEIPVNEAGITDWKLSDAQRIKELEARVNALEAGILAGENKVVIKVGESTISISRAGIVLKAKEISLLSDSPIKTERLKRSQG